MSTPNYLSNIEFRFVIKRLPNVEFYVQTATLPGINSGFTPHPTPFKTVPRPGDKLEFEDLQITCVVDENLECYREVYNWLIGLTKPREFSEYKNMKESDDGIYSDATLNILDSKRNGNIEVNFRDMFPISVSGIEMDTKQSSVEAPTVDFTFKYNTYDIQILS